MSDTHTTYDGWLGVDRVPTPAGVVLCAASLAVSWLAVVWLPASTQIRWTTEGSVHYGPATAPTVPTFAVLSLVAIGGFAAALATSRLLEDDQFRSGCILVGILFTGFVVVLQATLVAANLSGL